MTASARWRRFSGDLRIISQHLKYSEAPGPPPEKPPPPPLPPPSAASGPLRWVSRQPSDTPSPYTASPPSGKLKFGPRVVPEKPPDARRRKCIAIRTPRSGGDVRLLGQLLGEILQEQEGRSLFERVEEVRNLSKRARRGEADAAETLSGVLSRLPMRKRRRVARSFAHFLALANIAEQHHQVRRRQAYLLTGRAQRNSLEASFARLISDGVPKEKLWQTVCGLSVELVLTAHPTEVVRRTLLQKHRNISDMLERLDRVALTPVEQEQLQQALRREISAAWLTDQVRRDRPTPVDEAHGGMVIFEQTIWDALPAYLRLLNRALQRHTGQALPMTCTPIRFGTWMGGDRDGNPRVTPRATEEVCLLARWMAASLYYREINALRVELSMNHCSEEMRAVVGDAWEPYRHLLRGVRQRLGATRDAMAARLAHREPASDVPPYMDHASWKSLCCCAGARYRRRTGAPSPRAVSPTFCADSPASGLRWPVSICARKPAGTRRRWTPSRSTWASDRTGSGRKSSACNFCCGSWKGAAPSSPPTCRWSQRWRTSSRPSEWPLARARAHSAPMSSRWRRSLRTCWKWSCCSVRRGCSNRFAWCPCLRRSTICRGRAKWCEASCAPRGTGSGWGSARR